MKTTIAVIIEGGLVQAVIGNCQADVVVVDYDVEGADSSDIKCVPQGEAVEVEGFISRRPVERNPKRAAELLAAAKDPITLADVESAAVALERAPQPLKSNFVNQVRKARDITRRRSAASIALELERLEQTASTKDADRIDTLRIAHKLATKSTQD